LTEEKAQFFTVNTKAKKNDGDLNSQSIYRKNDGRAQNNSKNNHSNYSAQKHNYNHPQQINGLFTI
jgi:hypothetical protein